MSENSSRFTNIDARDLRTSRPTFSGNSGADVQAAQPALRRYLDHYGFSQLLDSQPGVEHTLGFHAWHDYTIARHSWRLPDARGTAVIVHGLFDHSGLYLRLVQRLLATGYNVVSFDLPGHGLSSGARVTIGDFREYGKVLSDCLSWCAEHMPGPYFAIGQSTGCSAIMCLLLDRNPAAALLQKAALLAPLVRIQGWSGVVLAHALLGRLLKQVVRRFGANSHDKDFLDFLCHQDPLQARYIAVPWVGAMRGWVKKFKSAPVTDNQLLVVQGTADATVDWRWNIPLIQQKFPCTRVHYVRGALHHLVNEADPWRDEVFEALDRFLSA